jgi:hypothetical protein
LQELPVSVRLIREIHQRLLHGVRGMRLAPGELRTSQNWIGAGGCTLSVIPAKAGIALRPCCGPSRWSETRQRYNVAAFLVIQMR